MKQAKKPTVKPLPDLKAATADVLSRIAGWAESPEARDVMFGHLTSRTTKAEWAVLEAARQLAVNYVRMGAQQ
jgi:hypothetical protein